MKYTVIHAHVCMYTRWNWDLLENRKYPVFPPCHPLPTNSSSCASRYITHAVHRDGCVHAITPKDSRGNSRNRRGSKLLGCPPIVDDHVSEKGGENWGLEMKERCNLPQLKDRNLQLCFCWKSFFFSLSFSFSLFLFLSRRRKTFSHAYMRARARRKKLLYTHVIIIFISGIGYCNDLLFMRIFDSCECGMTDALWSTINFS